MPLFDSFSTAQSFRLPKMNSVPTTDDLKYAIAEGQKRIGKTIELPFEHPHNHQLFILKLNLSNKGPSSWTFQRGDGASAVRLWNRTSDDTLMIQNKVKIDSQVVADDSETAQHNPSQPMSLQVSFGGGPDINNPLGGGVATAAPVAAPEVPFGNQDFYEKANQQAVNAFAAPPQIAAAPADSWVDNLIQPPVFNPNASKTNMPALHPGTAAAVTPAARPAPPLPVAELEPQVPEPASEPAPQPAQAEKPGSTNLPPPIKLDVTLIDRINATLLDDATGLHGFPAFVYFLFREHDLYKRSWTPFSVVVFEVALRIGHENIALPGIALPAIIERLRNVLGEYDVVTHLSGGEFAALLPGTDAATVATFAQSLHTAVTSEPLTAGSRGETVLAAVGMATTPDTCNDPEVLIAAARQAKETAKSLPHPILMFPT